MAASNPNILPAAKPRHGDHFDAWNSSSTGHQRAENRLGSSIGWRQSRSMKLSHQFKSGVDGGKRISDSIGAGSEDWDEKAKALIPKDVRARAQTSVRDMIVSQISGVSKNPQHTPTATPNDRTLPNVSHDHDAKGGIFSGLVIYVNGSTYPLVSDHKLKHLLAEQGAKISIHLGRRQVTHVILGRPSGTAKTEVTGPVSGAGAGGGLAASKIQKEIRRIGGCSVKYVGVEWVLDSIKNGKRLPEAKYSNLSVAAKSQQSVYSLFKKSSIDTST